MGSGDTRVERLASQVTLRDVIPYRRANVGCIRPCTRSLCGAKDGLAGASIVLARSADPQGPALDWSAARKVIPTLPVLRLRKPVLHREGACC